MQWHYNVKEQKLAKQSQCVQNAFSTTHVFIKITMIALWYVPLDHLNANNRINFISC